MYHLNVHDYQNMLCVYRFYRRPKLCYVSQHSLIVWSLTATLCCHLWANSSTHLSLLIPYNITRYRLHSHSGTYNYSDGTDMYFTSPGYLKISTSCSKASLSHKNYYVPPGYLVFQVLSFALVSKSNNFLSFLFPRNVFLFFLASFSVCLVNISFVMSLEEWVQATHLMFHSWAPSACCSLDNP